MAISPTLSLRSHQARQAYTEFLGPKVACGQLYQKLPFSIQRLFPTKRIHQKNPHGPRFVTPCFPTSSIWGSACLREWSSMGNASNWPWSLKMKRTWNSSVGRWIGSFSSWHHFLEKSTMKDVEKMKNSKRWKDVKKLEFFKNAFGGLPCMKLEAFNCQDLLLKHIPSINKWVVIQEPGFRRNLSHLHHSASASIAKIS